MSFYSDLIPKYDIFDKEKNFSKYVLMFLRITNRIFKYTGLPDTIPARTLEKLLQMNGVIFFYKTNPAFSAANTEKLGEGLYVFTGGYGGAEDVYYEPTIANISNPCCPDIPMNLEIGKDCCVMWNDSFRQGLLPIIQKYAFLLVESDLSILDAEYNLRIQSLIQASDDRTRASAELWLQHVIEGKPGIIAGKSLDPETALATKPFATGGQTNAMSQLIEMHQYLKASFLNEIGLNANYNMKRERINSAETELNNDGLLPLVDDMLHEREEALVKVNEMFGTDIKVEKASAWEFRQLAAEVDAMNPEGIIPDEEQKEEAPEEAPDQEETADEAPEEEQEETPEKEPEEEEKEEEEDEETD